MIRGLIRIGFGIALVLVFIGLFPAPVDAVCIDTLRIFVSILPQKYFVEQVIVCPADIQVLVGPGQSPHTFEPTPKQIAALSEADIYFRIGLPFEDRLLEKSASIMKRVRIVDTRDGITLRPMEAHHGGEDEHGGALDPHIWLDPNLVKQQAKNIYLGLGRFDSLHLPDYQDHLFSFQKRLDSLDTELAEKLSPVTGKNLLIFHPTFGYFCDRYGLKQVAIETEGKEPSARQLAGLIEQAKKDKVKAIIVQSQFSKKTAEAIASEIGAEVISVDPLAYDYIDNMKSIADTIAKALSK